MVFLMDSMFVWLIIFGFYCHVVSTNVRNETSNLMLLKHHLVPYANQGQTDAYTGGIDEGLISSQRDKSIEPSNDSTLDTNSEANSLSVYQIIEVHRFPH